MEAGIAKMVEALTPLAEEKGEVGTVHRAMLAILPGAVRWAGGEFNRNTPPDQCMMGLAVVAANMVASQVTNVVCDLDVKVSAVNEFMRVFAEQVHLMLTLPSDPDRTTTVSAEEVGHG
jgi:hypothetical protein